MPHPLSVDVEAALVAYLAPLLPGARVATTVPKTIRGDLVFTDSLVTVRRVGGPAASLVHDRPMIVVEGWHQDKTRAAQLVLDARGAMLDAYDTAVLIPPLSTGDPTEKVFVSHHSETGGVADYPDPRTDLYRYQFTHQMTVRR